jgi:hypothetical protein
MVLKFADNRYPNSLASRLRAKRNEWFRSLLSSVSRPITILDVGGAETTWEAIGFADQPDVRITLINIDRSAKASHDNVSLVIGDARDMRQFGNAQFDVIYSNSVIEHVGSPDDMRQMAQEVRRIGKRYFVQTPSKYFPIEPHFVLPFFQFLPRPIQVALVQNFQLGWCERQPEKKHAERLIDSIRLLSHREMRDLFPDATIIKERFLGLTKSLIACKM